MLLITLSLRITLLLFEIQCQRHTLKTSLIQAVRLAYNSSNNRVKVRE